MRPLFTIQAGEFLVGEYIERHFPSLNVWVPSRDTGVDLLVTDAEASRTVSLQVKLSRDYKGWHEGEGLADRLITTGWTVIDHRKLAQSPADLWVFVLVPLEKGIHPYFLVIPPDSLLQQLVKIHGQTRNYHFYPWVLRSGKKVVCVHGRGLNKAERKRLGAGEQPFADRDFTAYLERWDRLRDLAAHP